MAQPRQATLFAPVALTTHVGERSLGARRGNLLGDVACIGALLACCLVLHRDGLLGGPAFYELDTRLFYYPLSDWVAGQLKSGSFPLWLPNIFTGYPLFADGELGLLYLPQVLLLFSLPTPVAMVWLRVLNTFMAGLFMYLFLRGWCLASLPALGGAVVFAFGSFLTAQMHHENVIRSSIWLPAVFACFVRAASAASNRRAVRWCVLGALAFSQAAVGLHVQPVLMIALALGLYAIFRGLVSGLALAWPVLVAGGIGVGGLTLAAAQWIPLGEWALSSSRRAGVEYEFASAFSLPPPNLLSLIFPYFFRLPDATTWWSLWQHWEIELYVGIPTLALVLVGLLFARRTDALFLAVLGLAALLIGMAHYAPFNLHALIWSVPGFSFLRAPGRFSLLIVFACAGLAGFGLQALRDARPRVLVALVGAVPSVALLAGSVALLPSWHDWLAADSARAEALLDSTYLATRAQYPIEPGLALVGMLSSLELTNPKTLWSLVLLALTAVGFVMWLEFGHRRASLAEGLFVGLLVVDLLTFAYDFHPRAPLESLRVPLPPGVSAGDRVLMHDAPDMPTLEPNQLLVDGVQLVDGYSSLPSQRHVELTQLTSSQPALLDLWSATRILEPVDPPDGEIAQGVSLRLHHPLVAAFGGAAPVTYRIPSGTGPVAAIRIIGALGYAYDIPGGQPVAEVIVDGQVVPIRAGVELAERAIDRPSLAGVRRHDRGQVALDFEEATPQGEVYLAHLYWFDVPLPDGAAANSVTFSARNTNVVLDVHGIGLVRERAVVRSLDLGDRQGLERVGPGVLADPSALPRAYVLPRSQGFWPAGEGLVPTQVLERPTFDEHRDVLIERDSSVGSQPVGTAPARSAAVQDLGTGAVRVTATADSPSYLVLTDLYHRGWNAYIDGQRAPMLVANAIFRAVAIEPGTHVVDFRFEPISHVAGAIVSGLALLSALGLLASSSRRWVR
jgi:hypothetical protein